MAEVCHLARLCFLGLLTLADRDGRLEDRAKWIAIKLFPYEREIDVSPLLEELAADRNCSPGAFIRRYTVDGRGYIQISNFSKYQNPHPKEQESTFPSPPPVNGAKKGTTRRAVKKNGNAAKLNCKDTPKNCEPRKKRTSNAGSSGSSIPSGSSVLASESTGVDSWPAWYHGIAWNKPERKVEFTEEAQEAISEHIRQLAEDEGLPPLTKSEAQRGWGRLNGWLMRNRQCTGPKSLPPIVVNWLENDLRDNRTRGSTVKRQALDDVFDEAMRKAEKEERGEDE